MRVIINQIKAWWRMDTDWYFEVYKIRYHDYEKLNDEDKQFLSRYKNKSELQTALSNIGVNLYWGKRVSIKEGVQLIKKSRREE